MKTGGLGNQGFVYLSTKRLFDIFFSLLGLIFFAPAMLVTALWVRLDSPGPVFFRQRRVGKDGSEFDILKFRTMHPEAESHSGPVWAQKDDARVTRAGRLLRKLYLDETPQLFNILKGDMSFVGPRPERPFFYPQCEEVAPGFSSRIRVQPGLTGLAQVSQSHNPSTEAVRRKFHYDLMYMQRQSFVYDLRILFRTGGLLWQEFKEIWQ
jgi:lipopolysaccharide/colanic/teichoic acid biosynthesis glycosyltransferase